MKKIIFTVLIILVVFSCKEENTEIDDITTKCYE